MNKTIKKFIQDGDKKSSYNRIEFEKKINKIFLNYDKIIKNRIVDSVSNYFLKESKFSLDNGIKLLTRNIIDTEYVLVVEDVIHNPDKIVSSDKIILGVEHNFPRKHSVGVKRLENNGYEFKNLDDIIKLSEDIYRIDYIKEYMNTDYIFNIPKLERNFGYKNTIKSYYDADFPASIIKKINKYVKVAYNIEFEENNIIETIINLYSLGLTDIYNAVISKDYKLIDDIVQNFLTMFNFGMISKNRYIDNIRRQSKIAIAKRIIQAEIKDSDKIIESMVYGVSDIKDKIPEKMYNRINELINKHIEINTSKCEIHRKIIEIFHDMYNNLKYDKGLEDVEYIIKQVVNISDKNGGLYFCKSCKYEIACDHQFEFLRLKYKRLSNEYDEKQKIVAEYKSNFEGDIVYCKYCSQKIFHDQTSTLLTGNDFEEMLKHRKSKITSNTESTHISEITYRVVWTVLSIFKFKYEDFSSRELVKMIHITIFPKVYNLLLSNKIDDTDKDETARYYAYVFGLIYMMNIYLKDDNISIPSLKKKNANDFAKYIIPKIGDRFKTVSEKHTTQKLLNIAFKELKTAYITQISYVDEFVNLISIVNNVQYDMVLKLYNIDRVKRGDKPVSKSQSIKHLLPSKLLNLNEVNFKKQLVIPKPDESLLSLCYRYLFDDSPTNYFSKDKYSKTALKRLDKFSSELEDKIKTISDKLDNKGIIRRYNDFIKSKTDHNLQTSHSFEYIYDAEGNIIKWEVKYSPKKDSKPYLTRSGYISKINNYVKNIKVEYKGVDFNKIKKGNVKEIIEKRNNIINFKPTKKNKSSAIKYKKLKSEDEEEEYTFVTVEKNYSVVNISARFHTNMVKLLGQTEDSNHQEIRSGKLEPKEFITGDIRIVRVHKYAMMLIVMYNSLYYRPDLKKNEIYFKSQDEIKNFQSIEKPIINTVEANNETGTYYEMYNKISLSWIPSDVYKWIIQFIVDKTKLIIEMLGKVGENFVHNYYNIVFKEEAFLYWVKIDRRGTGEDATEEDSIETKEKKDKKLSKKEYGEGDEDNYNIT